MTEQNIRIKPIEIGILFAISFSFVLFFCIASSPITDRNTNDSAIFISMGKMFVEGKIPYVDFFDHKGPSLILLEAIPQFFVKDRLAIFFLEVFNLFIVLLLITKISNLLKFNTIKKITLWSLFLLLISRLLTNGNTGEELSLIPLFIALYYLCRYYFIEKKIVNSHIFILGVCFSFLFWLRANNGGFIVGICIYMFIDTIINKDYKSMKNLILYFILGQLPFSILYLTYFLYHNALYELIYATFLFNINYVHAIISPSMHSLWINLLIFVLLLVSSILFYLKTKKDYKIFILCTVIYLTCALVVNMGYSFQYYYLLYAPAFMFGSILLIKSYESDSTLKIIFITSSILLIAFGTRKSYYMAKEGKIYKDTVKKETVDFLKLFEKIPSNERDKIFYYDQFPTIFYLEEVTSNYKYCFIQEWHGRHNNKIFDEINETMRNNTPHYVFINQFSGDTINEKNYHNQDFFLFLKDNYHVFADDKNRVIMKLNSLE